MWAGCRNDSRQLSVQEAGISQITSFIVISCGAIGCVVAGLIAVGRTLK